MSGCKGRRAYGGMDIDTAKELKELREQNARLKREVGGRFCVQLPSAPPSTCSRTLWACRDGWRARPLGWPLHPQPSPTVADPSRSGRRNEGLATRLRRKTPLPWGSGVPGRRSATTSAVRSTRIRSTDCGARKGCRSGP